MITSCLMIFYDYLTNYSAFDKLYLALVNINYESKDSFSFLNKKI